MRPTHPLRPSLFLLFILVLLASAPGLSSARLGPMITRAAAGQQALALSPAATITTTVTVTPTPTPTQTTTATLTPTATATTPACLPDSYEPDDNAFQAQPITVDGVFQMHHFEPNGDIDWVKFQAAQGWFYDIRTDFLTGADTVIFLIDSNGVTELAQNDDDPGRGLASRLSWQASASGLYYVRIEEYGNLGGCLGYGVALRASPPTFLPLILNAVGQPLPTPTPTLTPTPTRTPTPIPGPTATRTPTPLPSCLPTWETNIGLAAAPKGLAADNNRLFVGQYGSASLGVINTIGPAYLRTVPGSGRGANGLAPSNGRIYFAHRDSNTLSYFSAVDPQSLLGALPTGALPFGVAANASRVFVSNYEGDSVTVVNSLTNQILTTVAVGNGPALLAATANRVFVPIYNDGDPSGVRVLDNNGGNLGYIPTGMGPFAAAYNPNSNHIYISHWGDHRIVVLDASSLAVIDSFSTPGRPYDLALNPATNHLFVVGAANDAIYVYQMPGKQHLTSLAMQPIDPAHGGQGIAVWQNRIYVSIYASNHISVLKDFCP